MTFYSYKGGVGRTLAVANVAKYLSRFGQKVFAIDLDLEAPGLHYKLMLGQTPAELNIERGLVDYIDKVTFENAAHEELADYVVKVEERQESGGSIHILPAGRVPSAQYWRKLARINWHDLFYAEDAKGVPLFLDLKARIEREFAPDVILIDARTGITEMGGVATTLLADQVVCLLMHNIENLEGARSVLRSIHRTPRLPRQKPVELIAVITRIPQARRSDIEENLLNSAREFLNAPAGELSDTLNITDLFVLHSETDLQVTEELRIGGTRSFDESPLLRDYLRLFSKLIAREKIEPQLSKFVATALERSLDDPEGTQRELEALSASYPHSETYRALLKYYRLRRFGSEQILATASRLWDLTRFDADPLLWDIAREHFRGSPSAGSSTGYRADFLEAVWRAAGGTDSVFALRLSEVLRRLGDDRREREVLKTAMEVSPEGAVVTAYLGALRRQENWADAFEVIERHRRQFEDAAGFLGEWANAILGRHDNGEAVRFLEGGVRLTKLTQEQPATGIRLLLLAGRGEEADSLLSSLTQRAFSGGNSPELVQVGLLWDELNRSREFERRAAAELNPRALEALRLSLEEARSNSRLYRGRTRRPVGV